MTRVLVFLMSAHWVGIARLPRALTAGGFDVVTLSPANSHLSRTRYASRHVVMPTGMRVRAALLNTITATQPDLVIPGCEQAVSFLHLMVSEAERTPPEVRALLLRSLGNPDYFRATLSKHETIAAAAAAGIRVPAQLPVNSADDAWQFAGRYGYPVVLKAEIGASGSGVRICDDADAVVRALAQLHAVAAGQDVPRIVVQQHIAGSVAFQSVAAVAGEVLERLSAEKIEYHPRPSGPSSVVRLIEHAGMDGALDALIAHLGFTGIGGADFILDADRQAWLLELNPRPTPICHLGAAAGHDLARALWCRLNNTPYERIRPAQPLSLVAFFPQEIIRDANSHWLTDAYHDVPADDPALLASLSAYARRRNPALRQAPRDI